jgi:hypothetical protein
VARPPGKRPAERRRTRVSEADCGPAVPAPVRHREIILSDDYYDHRIAARARGQQLLPDVPDLLDDVMTRSDRILASLLDLFGPEAV